MTPEKCLLGSAWVCLRSESLFLSKANYLFIHCRMNQFFLRRFISFVHLMTALQNVDELLYVDYFFLQNLKIRTAIISLTSTMGWLLTRFSYEMIWGETKTIHSHSALFFFFFFKEEITSRPPIDRSPPSNWQKRWANQRRCTITPPQIVNRVRYTKHVAG